jgi:GTPase SAR1 family protein
MEINPQLELAYQYVEFTNKHIFLTGKAGTGKTTFLHELKKKSPKRAIVVAPTGVAAINAGGVTIHSFFQIPFGPFIPRDANQGDETPYAAGNTRVSKAKINIIRSLDLLIIDEISMVRADLLDGIDEVLRRYRRTTKPFGGVQLLMIGDIRQLSPIVKDEEREILKPYYNTFYFYGSRALQKTDFVSIELLHVYRQSDRHFIDMLNKIRENQADENTLKELNKQYIPGFSGEEEDSYIILTTHNRNADEVNQKRLEKLKSKTYIFHADINGNFPEYMYPTHEELILKTGAQVMFVKNDPSPDKKFYNGKIGVIEGIYPEDESIRIRCAEDNSTIYVGQLTWENTKYTIHPETKEIEEEIIGGFDQYPLKLAWAITIHKSQGLTFEKAIIDAQDSFAHGQVYVALSRCRSLEGIVLSTPVKEWSIKSDASVSQFSKEVEENMPGQDALKKAKTDFQRETILELFDFKVLQYRIAGCIKHSRENSASLITDLVSSFQQMINRAGDEIFEVAEKFHSQLLKLLNDPVEPEQNLVLQKRILSAANYFSGKLNIHVFDILDTLTIDTDNKQAKKQLSEAFMRLQQEATLKKACLDACNNGFRLKEFLDIRAKAAIEEPKKRKTQPVAKDYSTDDIENRELFEILRRWRNLEALEQQVPAYRILTQKALVGIAAELPVSSDDLVKIKGIGKRTAQSYGTMILEILSDYCQQHDIEYKANFEIKFEEKKKKADKPDTKRITLDFYIKGYTIQEIVAKRGLTYRTIEGHLAHFIEKGELNIAEFLSDAELNEIISVIEKSENQSLTPLKEKLNHKYDYGVLKMAVAYYRATM